MRERGREVGHEIKLFLVMAIASLILMVLDVMGFLAVPRGIWETFFSPVKSRIYALSTNSRVALGLLWDIKGTLEQDVAYKKSISEIDKLSLEATSLKEENESLRKQLESPLPSTWKYLPVKVLGVSRYLLIWGGERDGIKKGMNVVWGVYFLGKVVDTSTYTSSVLLLSDPDADIPVVSNRGSRGRVVGKFGEKIYIDHVLQKEALFIDDQVLTTGEEGIAGGLVVGKINEIESKDFEVYKRGEIKLPLDIKTLSTVFVVMEM